MPEQLRRAIVPGLLVLALLCGGLFYYFSWAVIYSEGVLRDGRYGYTLIFPENWRRLTDDEEDDAMRFVKSQWKVDYRFLGTGSDPDETAVVIVVVDDEDFPATSMVKDVLAKGLEQSGANVELNESVQIDGQDVERIGFSMKNQYYMELIFFESRGHVVIIEFLCKEPVRQVFFEDLDATISSLTFEDSIIW